MSKPISKYEKEVMGRIDQLRINKGYSMEFFSEFIGVDLETYKRTKYNKIRADLDFIRAVGEKFPANMDYILFGKAGQNYKLINTYISGSNEERAQVFDELARFSRDEKKAMERHAEKLRKKAIEKYDVDYQTDAGLVEKPKRKSTTAVKKTAEKVAVKSQKK